MVLVPLSPTLLIGTRFARIVTPEPPQRIRKNRAAVPVTVETGSPLESVVVAGILQRPGQRLIRKPPASGSVVEIVAPSCRNTRIGFFGVLRTIAS